LPAKGEKGKGCLRNGGGKVKHSLKHGWNNRRISVVSCQQSQWVRGRQTGARELVKKKIKRGPRKKKGGVGKTEWEVTNTGEKRRG